MTKAQEANFRTEMEKVKEQVNLKIAQGVIKNKTLEEYFNHPSEEEARKWAKTLKTEIIKLGERVNSDEVTYLPQKYIENNNLLGLEDLYYVDKNIVEGKEKTYLYDKKSDIVFKIPKTMVGLKTVHSIEALDGKKELNDKEEQLSVIQAESNLVQVGNIVCYEPDLKGFTEERTSILYYKTNSDGTVDSTPEIVPVKEYLSQKNRTISKNGATYEFYNYKTVDATTPVYNSIWGNIKVNGSGVETYWTWIPRYAYKINGNATEIIYIDTSNKQASNGEALPEGYIVHPDFEDGKKGIWVSKYEIGKEQNNKAEEFPHYLPDLSGFDKENTYIEVYNDDGSFTETELANISNIGKKKKKNRWFDYRNQVWANIKTKAYDAECWWVWIPRYAYRIPSTAEPETQIIFVDIQDRPLSGEELPEGYIVHPAFEGGKKGIWASKYEMGQQPDKALNTANIPDLSGYNPETTWIELYKDDGTFEEVQLSTIDNLETFAKNNRWYDYSKQIWANIKVVNTQGTEETSDDVETWWVWIPSYAYYIYENETKVIFIDENGNPKEGGTLPSHYTVHPAFEGKKGIWASKYEIGEQN